MLARIYTEDKNRDKMVSLCSEYFDGFTVIPALGYWKGEKENSLVIEIADVKDPEIFTALVKLLAADIRIRNEQQAVLIEWIPSTHELIC